MTYGSQITVRTKYPYTTRSAAQRKAARKKLTKLRRLKRALHFLGFLCYWAVVLSISYLLALPVLVLFVCLA